MHKGGLRPFCAFILCIVLDPSFVYFGAGPGAKRRPPPSQREALAAARREAPAAVGREAPVVTSDYYTSIPLLDKHAVTRQALRY